MTTWQSTRHSNRRYARGRKQPSHEALRAKRARADAARMALPAPIYIDRLPGEWRGYIETFIDGHVTRVELHTPSDSGQRRARSDSFTGMLNGTTLATGGMHALWRCLVAKVLPRAMSRAMAATL